MQNPEVLLESSRANRHPIMAKVAAAGMIVGSFVGLGANSVEANDTGKLQPGEELCFPVAGKPGDLAIVNLTPVNGEVNGGFGLLHSSDINAVNASNVNFGIGTVDPNVATAPIGADGEVCFTNANLPGNRVDLIADHLASIDSAVITKATPSGAPDRKVDTRQGVTPEIGAPVVSGAIGGIVVTAACDNVTGFDYFQISNPSNEAINAKYSPSSDAQFEALNYNITVPPGGISTGITRTTTGTKPTISVSNRSGQVVVDLTPCGNRPPIITPKVTGSIDDIYVTRGCIGPNDGAVSLYIKSEAAIYDVNVDKGNDGTVDVLSAVFALEPRFFTQSFFGNLYSITIDQKPNQKLVVDYSPCAILPPEHNGNLTQNPL